MDIEQKIMIKDFLNEPYMIHRELEKEMGMPEGTIYQFTDLDKMIPVRYWSKMMVVLQKHGFVNFKKDALQWRDSWQNDGLYRDGSDFVRKQERDN